MKPWFRVAEPAEYIGRSRRSIYTACDGGELGHAHVGGRRTTVLRPPWMDAWLKKYAPDLRGGRTDVRREVAS
jgi:hypothetical protein